MVAMELLVKKRERLAIIGAGRVGYYVGLYAAALGGVQEIIYADIDREQAEICATTWAPGLLMCG